MSSGADLSLKWRTDFIKAGSGAIGFDGIWRAGSEPDIIIEVKTTDYFTLNLETPKL